MEVGASLAGALRHAREQGRVTSGVYECGKLLETDPERVMVCVLAEPAATESDVTLHIHSTLIEAFCWENDIRLVKVDSAEKICKILGDANIPINDNDLAAGRVARPTVSDCTCILIEHPDECTEAEEDLLAFHKVTFDVVPQPVIPLKV